MVGVIIAYNKAVSCNLRCKKFQIFLHRLVGMRAVNIDPVKLPIPKLIYHIERKALVDHDTTRFNFGSESLLHLLVSFFMVLLAGGNISILLLIALFFIVSN